MKDANKKPLATTASSVKVIAPVEPVEESYLPMLHGKATDAIARMSSKGVSVNPITGSLAVSNNEVKLVIESFNELKATLGVNSHKLLSVGIAQFASLNHIRTKAPESLVYGVTIPLKEYALRLGYDVIPHTTETPEEAEAEEERAKKALYDATKKIKKDLALLRHSKLPKWTEKIRGKSTDFDETAIIGSHGIRKGFIYMVFDPLFSEYLIRLPLTQYPLALLAVDARNSNAYSIGLTMAEHYSLDNNQKIGTAQLLKVKTLLSYTTLPSIEEMRKQRRNWEDRIKEPFESALDALTGYGVLTDWRYSKSKGEELTDEEATSFTSYEDWAETLVYFTLKDAPDHTARIEARQEEKKARQAKGKPLRRKASHFLG